MSHLVDWGDVESQLDTDQKSNDDHKSSTKKAIPKKIEKILSAEEFYYLCKCADAKRQGKLKFKIVDLKNKLQSITNFTEEN